MHEKIAEARKRCEYASKLLEKENISYVIKNKDIGQINLYYNQKVVMSFWARTGRYIFNVKNERTENIDINPDFDRGILKCIKIYKKVFAK